MKTSKSLLLVEDDKGDQDFFIEALNEIENTIWSKLRKIFILLMLFHFKSPTTGAFISFNFTKQVLLTTRLFFITTKIFQL